MNLLILPRILDWWPMPVIRLAEWLRHWTPEPTTACSNPAGASIFSARYIYIYIFFFFFFFFFVTNFMICFSILRLNNVINFVTAA